MSCSCVALGEFKFLISFNTSSLTTALKIKKDQETPFWLQLHLDDVFISLQFP